jgi:large subunit ribosomal protein L4e
MKGKLFNTSGEEKDIELPGNFSEELRPDVIVKVFEAQKEWQPHGTMYMAGAGYSASGILRRKRHAWKVTYGKGISRIPRKIMSRHGSSFNWIGATVNSARGGRRAHPPKVEENQYRKINKKELNFAMNSALSAIENVFVLDSDILKLKTGEMIRLFEKIFKKGFLKERKIRAGKGKARGRRYKKTAGLLIVVGSNEKFERKGIETTKAKELKMQNLAPRGIPGERKIAFTEIALKEIKETFGEK